MEKNYQSLSEVRKVLRPEWYRCPIDRTKLRELSKRSNFQGFFQAGGHLSLFICTGALVLFFWSQLFFRNSFRIFSTKKCSTTKIGSPISIPNDPKIPKITLRTACDHYKNTNNAHEQKTPLFLLYLTSGGPQVREPSV